MKKKIFILGFLCFISISASAQLTSGLMNYEVKHSLLPGMQAERIGKAVQKASEKNWQQIRAEKSAASAQEHLKGLLSYYKNFSERPNQPEDLKKKRETCYKLLVTFTEQHANLVKIAAEKNPERIALLKMRDQLEEMYWVWVEMRKLDAPVASEATSIVKVNCRYWVECAREAFSLYDMVNHIHKVSRVVGEGEGFF